MERRQQFQILDPTRKKICLLDEEKADLLFTSRYDGDFIFAFDNAELATLIEEKLNLISRHINLKSNRVKFYVLCGYDRRGKYDAEFLERDLQSVFDRADLLKQYGCLPYVMRRANYKQSPAPKTYVLAARWAKGFW